MWILTEPLQEDQRSLHPCCHTQLPPAGQTQNLSFPLIRHLARRTCDMLRLHSAGLHQEGLSRLECQDGLGLCRVSVEDPLKFSLLPVGWDAVEVGARLAVDEGRCGL